MGVAVWVWVDDQILCYKTRGTSLYLSIIIPSHQNVTIFFFFNYYSVGIVLGFQNLCHRIVTITMEYGGLLGFLFFGGALTEGIILV